jgi:hypothetical protein
MKSMIVTTLLIVAFVFNANSQDTKKGLLNLKFGAIVKCAKKQLKTLSM